jgi:hypothetical protein
VCLFIGQEIPYKRAMKEGQEYMELRDRRSLNPENEPLLADGTPLFMPFSHVAELNLDGWMPEPTI